MEISFNVNKLTKKGQITIFILIGLIILIISGLLFYLMQIQSQTQIQEKAQKTTAEIISSEGIANYVTSCLEDSLINGTLLLGKQGGYIYKEQPSATINYNIQGINYEGYKIPYAIRPLTAITNIAPPWYPCHSTESAPDYCKFVNTGQSSYYYGERRQFPVLYKSQETTKISIQKQLENYVINETKKCANFEELLSLPELKSYNITEEQPTAEIVFAENEIAAVLTYPIVLKPYGKEPIKHLLRFFGKVPVRFRKIYYAAEDIIAKENLELNYQLIENTTRGHYRNTQLNYYQIKEKANLTKITIEGDTVIIINDTGSKIKGQEHYEFQFARQNRPPVLDYIGMQIINITGESETYKVVISSTDPDETKTMFNTGEWNPLTTASATVANSHPKTYSSWKANITINAMQNNIGNYTLKVSTTDGQLEDWQYIRIWICNKSNKIGRLSPSRCIEYCGASRQCNEKGIEENLGTCIMNEYLEDICDSTCQIKSSGTCIYKEEECNAPTECSGLVSYSITTNKNSWCYGDQGCEKLCTTAIIDRQINNPPYTHLNDSFECGCIQGAKCDTQSYNMDFNGTCKNISNVMQCIGDTT